MILDDEEGSERELQRLWNCMGLISQLSDSDSRDTCPYWINRIDQLITNIEQGTTSVRVQKQVESLRREINRFKFNWKTSDPYTLDFCGKLSLSKLLCALEENYSPEEMA